MRKMTTKEKLLNLLLPHVKLEFINKQPIALNIHVLHCHCDLQIDKETFDELKELLKC